MRYLFERPRPKLIFSFLVLNPIPVESTFLVKEACQRFIYSNFSVIVTNFKDAN